MFYLHRMRWAKSLKNIKIKLKRKIFILSKQIEYTTMTERKVDVEEIEMQ